MPADKQQRIKLRLYKHPVKHDGVIISFAPDGAWFIVKFDGPLPNLKLWAYSETLATNLEPTRDLRGQLQLAAGAQLWEIL